jgi:hypothetical protein
VCVCVCVCEGERERERGRVHFFTNVLVRVGVEGCVSVSFELRSGSCVLIQGEDVGISAYAWMHVVNVCALLGVRHQHREIVARFVCAL